MGEEQKKSKNDRRYKIKDPPPPSVTGTMSWKSVLVLVLLLLLPCGCWSAGTVLERRPGTDLGGQHLRIAYVETEGMLVRRKTDPPTYQGLIADLWTILAKSMNFTYSFVEPTEADCEQQGPDEAVIGLLVRKKVDLIASPQVVTLATASRVDFTLPLLPGEVALLQPMPEVKYRFQVWIGSGLLVAVLWKIWASFRLQRRAAAAVLALAILGYLLCGQIASLLTEREPLLNTWPELAAVADAKRVVVLKNSAIHQLIRDTDSPVFRRLEESLRANPHHVVTTLEQVVTLLASDCCVFPAVTVAFSQPLNEAYALMERSVKASSGECGLTIGLVMADGIGSRRSLLLQKHSPHTEAFNRETTLLWERGTFQRLWRDDRRKRNVDRCIQRTVCIAPSPGRSPTWP